MMHSGSAAHGDYVFGWEGDSLQKAMDNGCTLNQACPKAGLTVQSDAQYSACNKKQQAPEDVDGCKFYPISPTKHSQHTNLLLQGSKRCRWARWPSKHRQNYIAFSHPSSASSMWRFLSSPHFALGSCAVIACLFNILAGRCVNQMWGRMGGISRGGVSVYTRFFVFVATCILHRMQIGV